MKLTILVDNNTYIDQYYLGEPAVSYYIEDEDKRILFDTGYSDIVLSNAEKMGIDLNRLTHIILSHGHDDHTRGLRYLHEKLDLSKVQLIAHPGCFAPKYVDGAYIGAPYDEAEIRNLVNYRPSQKPLKIIENLTFLGEIPRKNDFENQSPIGVCEKSGERIADYLLDDTALAYTSENGIFVITGCSHSGICNIVEYAKEVSNDDRVYGVLGGFHLFEDNEQLKKTIAYFKNCNIKKLYPCHCVSLLARAKMMTELPVVETGVGMKLQLKKVSNYENMKRQMQKEFLKYNQNEMLEKIPVKYDENYFYLQFVARLYRIDRKTGQVCWSEDNFVTYREADYNEAMTIYDVLCYSKSGCHVSGEFVNMKSLSSIQAVSANTAKGFFQKQEAFFDHKENALATACEKLGGNPYGKGDVAYRLLLFEFLPMAIQFWNSDEEFPASLQIFMDKNILDYMHYETVWFAVSHVLARLTEEMQK